MTFFNKFLDNIVHQREAEEDDSFEVRGKKPEYHGTIVPYPNFRPRMDASVLEEAINGKNVDEETIITLLVQRTNEQRQEIAVAYEKSTDKSLVKELKSELRSDLEDVILGLMLTPAQFDAFLLRKATKGLGTSEDILTEVLTSRTNKQIKDLARAFEEENGKSLEDVIKKETKGDFTQALLAMLEAKKDESHTVNPVLARKDALTLFESSEESDGIDVSVFIDILTSRNGPQLAQTFKSYSKMSDVNLPKALDMHLKGDIEDCLIDIVKCAWSTPAFFAEKLHNAMKGHGTCEYTLMRVLVSRSEVDLKRIVDEFQAMYGKPLQECILEDTKGHFENILLRLCGPV
ncbi:hypothetical protein NHX12_027055 [Muraenolepis orangiensis]|uniref:Annexin n=1 Tax=Muraenolepis orangiensis TaxID=630683 RepID=A0A9Q0INF9_9TELE|nr:hypothetical protein NHX12_027055 [Muraenolepis orangiensis]